jgi:hypothetical protein
MKNIRQLAILLLDDENGINEAAFNELAPALVESGNQDVLDAVNAQDGRYFIGESDADALKGGSVEVSADDSRYFPTETPLGEQIEGD